MSAWLTQVIAVLGLLTQVACVRPSVAERSTHVAMDSSAVRRLCAQPDSVLAGRGPCVLLDQAPVLIRGTPRP